MKTAMIGLVILAVVSSLVVYAIVSPSTSAESEKTIDNQRSDNAYKVCKENPNAEKCNTIPESS